MLLYGPFASSVEKDLQTDSLSENVQPTGSENTPDSSWFFHS
jgi:hypothetical protein